MGTRVPALVNPALLVWAREKAGYRTDEVARRLRVTNVKILSWEAGDAKPSLRQARLLAHAYRRPLALFYLATPPTDFKAMLHDYRRLPGQEPSGAAAELAFEIRRAAERREIALQLLEEAQEEPPSFPDLPSDPTDPDGMAASIREALGMGLEDQTRLRSSYEALSAWRSALENQGVLVFQTAGVDMADMRGASVNGKPLPVVLLNSADSPNGRIFTMMHELVHLVFGQSGICDIADEVTRLPDDQATEVLCNRVAGAILVPEEALRSEPLARRYSGSDWPDECIQALAQRYRVSREVILRRLVILGRMPSTFYTAKVAQYRAEYRNAHREKVGFAPPYALAISRAGRFFTGLVLESYHRERITSSRLSEYLNLRLKHVARLEEALHTVGNPGG